MSLFPRFSTSLGAGVALAALLAACSPGPKAGTELPADVTSAEPVKMAVRHVDNFELKDETGKSHALSNMKDARAVVLVMQGNGCPIVRKLIPTLKQVAGQFADKNVKFFMLNANSQDTPQAIAAEATTFELGIPVLKDVDQSVARQLGAERTAEVFVIDPKTSNVVFHGPIDDRLSYGTERAVADNHYLINTLNNMLAGKPVPMVDVKADGCIINYVTPEKA